MGSETPSLKTTALDGRDVSLGVPSLGSLPGVVVSVFLTTGVSFDLGRLLYSYRTPAQDGSGRYLLWGQGRRELWTPVSVGRLDGT